MTKHNKWFQSLLNKVHVEHILLLSFLIMLVIITFVPNIEYDSAFRLHIAQDYQFTVLYIHGVTFLPAYQFVAAAAGSIIILRILSALCVVTSGLLFNRIVFELTSSKRKAALTSALLVLNPLILLYGSLAMSETLAMLLMILMLYFYVKDKFALSAIALSIGVFTAYWFWAFLPFFMWRMTKTETSQIDFHTRYNQLRTSQFFELRLWIYTKRALVYILPIFCVLAWGAINFFLEKNPLHFLDVSKIIYAGLSPKITAFGASNLWFIFWYPILYVALPLIATFALFLQASKVRSILWYFITAYTVLLTTGLISGVIFAWARYFIPLIPAYLLVISPRMFDSKFKYHWIVLYFVIGTLATIWQAQVVFDFQKIMLALP